MSNVRRQTWHTRRRTRSVGSIPFTWQPQNLLAQLQQTQSDEMCSSSTSKDKDCSAYYQSDSDDVCSSVHNEASCSLLTVSSVYADTPNMESDSFNENSPCRRSTRRKRKFKKVAMEVELCNHSRFYAQPHYTVQSYTKKKRIMRHMLNCQRGGVWLNSGKRKRSTKEKFKLPLDSNDSSDFGKDSKGLTLSKLSLDEYPEEQFNSMEVSYTVTGVSPSNISSSGSETEICTNDEGREGDDEQSDWIGDVGLATGGEFNENDLDKARDDEMYFTYRNYPSANIGNVLSEDKKSGKMFSERGRDVDIRITRRRGKPIKPNFNYGIVAENKTSKPISSFSDDTLRKNDMDIESAPVTRRQTFSGYKKRKRLPPNSVTFTDITF